MPNLRYIVHVFIILVALVIACFTSGFTEDFSRDIILFSKEKISNPPNIDQNSVDSLGVPYTNYGYYGDTYIGQQRNPVHICQMSFEYYDHFMQGDYAAREKVISCADWLIENANYSGNYAILDYSFPWPMYNMTPPWHSGMAQGLTLQTMILAHKITHDEKYLSYGDLVVKSFYVDVDDGGVTQKTINDGWWYEEYASTHGDNPRVLNGMMYALLGLYDYYAYTGNPDAKDLFDLGVLALEKEIALYDDDGYSYYDILGNPAHKYHPIHIELSHKLYTLTGKEVFLYYSNKWETYDRAYFVVRLLKEPSKLNLAILLFNGTVIFIGLEGLAYLWYIKRGKNQI